MSHERFSVRIDDVVQLLGLVRDPRAKQGAANYNVQCPFCDKAGKYHMNINTVKDVYFCPHCMDSGSRKNTGALDLYGRVRFGEGLIPGVNGKELYIKLRREMDGDAFRSYERRPVDTVEDILPQSDEELNKTYRALLSLPMLRLSKKHASALMKRGLTETDIRLRYGSLPDPKFILKRHPMAMAADKWYKDNDIQSLAKVLFPSNTPSKEEILAGYLVAGDLNARGVNLRHVSGFYLMRGSWCFRYVPGILIPTCSLDGNIVGMQIRRDVTTEHGLRYMTVSSKDLPEGPTVKIARTHITHDQPINKDTTLYLTEGPLKADVICSLLNQRGDSNIAVIAIQGVNNTKGLPTILGHMKEKGITTVKLVFDMDKTGNMHVARAVCNIRKLVKESGMKAVSLCWDEKYAFIKRKELADLCNKSGIPAKATDNPFEDIYTMARALNASGVEYNVIVVNGKKRKNHWVSESKGFDDFLHNVSVNHIM